MSEVRGCRSEVNAANLSQQWCASGASLAPRATETGGSPRCSPVAERLAPLELAAFGSEVSQRTERCFVLKTYWRDNRNPFPGRLVEVKRARESRGERAWREFVRRSVAERDAREWAAWKRNAGAFEELADRTCESCS